MCGVDESTLLPPYRLLERTALNWEYGSRHSHEELAEITGLPVRTSRFYAAISAANKRLLIYGKILKSIRGIGYETLQPDDYNPHSVTLVKQGERKISKSVRVLCNAPEEHMSQNARRTRRQLYDRTSALELSTHEAVNQLERFTPRPAINVRTSTREETSLDTAQ
jgi:hypothetical protein